MSLTSTRDIQDLGKIMGVWAHPDDETFSSAGIMAAAVKNGQEVICLTATRGESGVQDEDRWPKAKLAKIREKELEKALRIIGVKHHEWLNYKDGYCEKADSQEAIKCICAHIEQYKPDTILTFGPDGMTGHPDHKTVSTWASCACGCVKNPPKLYHAAITHKQYKSYFKQLDEELNVFFNIDKPKLVSPEECAVYFELSDELKNTKFTALCAMPSQTEGMMKAFDKDFICNSLSPEVFVLAK